MDYAALPTPDQIQRTLEAVKRRGIHATHVFRGFPVLQQDAGLGILQ